ncbi:hypothetical protein C0995_007577 [Termitomyces sp. Mi166|nr:hypothetical protein C0995_007577 [Termitomyces sp. Mi166\
MRRPLYRTSGHVDAVELPDAADEPPPPSPTARDPSTSEGTSSQVQRVSSSQPHLCHHPRPTPLSHTHHHTSYIHIDVNATLIEIKAKNVVCVGQMREDMDVIYYVGVSDILTPYRGKKKLEHFWKGLSADRHKISPVPPSEYADRFLAFMKVIMRGGEGGARFKAE